MSDFSDHDVTGLNNKLQAFSATLTPGQQQIFGGLMNAAKENLSTSDVHGYDGGGNTDLLTKINWDALTTMSAVPGQVVDHGNLGGGNQ